ncbi:MAG: hypothetical protein IPP13_28005 [Kouleothrix sp.]|nr:hypothetical protein [Kouleothrix sp.]
MFRSNLNPSTPPDRASAVESLPDQIHAMTCERNQYSLAHENATGEWAGAGDTIVDGYNALIADAQSFLASLLGGKN